MQVVQGSFVLGGQLQPDLKILLGLAQAVVGGELVFQLALFPQDRGELFRLVPGVGLGNLGFYRGETFGELGVVKAAPKESRTCRKEWRCCL
jgi:hypothetical protein